jgi:hypothetical protein
MSEMHDIYESCQTFQKSKQLDVLDHLLEINFIHVPTKKVLKRVRFYVSADEALAAYIKTHPTFQKGCWPLGLLAIRDWCWKIKFVEVEKTKMIEGGAVDPNFGTTHLRAEFDSLDGENWLVPLINLANTHIMDQLRQFYEDEPKALPTPERIVIGLEHLSNKAQENAKSFAAQQEKNRQSIQKTEKRVWVFIDESGDPGFKETEEVYIYTSVIVPEESYGALKATLLSLLKKHWNNQPPSEIHFSKINEPRRGAVQVDLSDAILAHNVRIICFVANKWPFLKHLLREHTAAREGEELPLDVIWQEITSNKDYYLQFNFLSSCMEDAISELAIELIQSGTAASFIHDRKHKPWMNDALQNGFEKGIETASNEAQAFFGAPLKPNVTFSTVDSKDEPCLWLGDWISNEVRHWCLHEKVSPAFMKTQDSMSFVGYDSEGVRRRSKILGGIGEKSLPEIKRKIQKGNPIANRGPAANGVTRSE